ncbi:MAG: hypothetical protein SAL70_24895 [Scytonema sp. PMC 1070.18]|nr:hypothetical protein [Scytonema sp. PMC 1070.18]
MKSLKQLLSVAVSVGIFFLQSCTSSENINTKENTDKLNNQQSISSTPTQQLSPKATTAFDQKKAAQLTDLSKFIAGIEVDSNSSLAQFQKYNSWVNHRKFFDKAWTKLDTQQLAPVRQWSQKELAQINATSPSVFYPFSGPDFLYAYSFFPQSKQYVLVGLEPVGSVPDLVSLSKEKQDRKLQEVRSSLYAILQFSFFRTNDMKVDLQKQGVLPILYVFLARTQNRILDVQQIGLDQDANIQPFKKGMISGVKISFIPEGESETRTLYYFSTNLANDGLQKQPELQKFVAKLDNKVSYLKAASYLMYNDYFSDIRKLILTHSTHVLQDDSGIPLQAFDRSQWNLQFFGSYRKPIGLFSNRYQSELRKIYTSDKSVKPLDFGIGYHVVAKDSNLMLATAKNISAAKP